MMKAKLKLEAQPNAICKGKKLVVVMTVNGLQLMKNNAIISNLITLPYEALSICISSGADSTIYVCGRDNNIHIYQVNGDGDDETNKVSGARRRPIHSPQA
jgi:hypothetical protein